ncbi:MAG: hypothetical protein ACQESK_10135 [Bacteroidota bacterium]
MLIIFYILCFLLILNFLLLIFSCNTPEDDEKISSENTISQRIYYPHKSTPIASDK